MGERERGAPGGGWYRFIEIAVLLVLMYVLPRLSVLEENLALSYLLLLVCVTGLGFVFREMLRER
jgi:hypothetical protein